MPAPSAAPLPVHRRHHAVLVAALLTLGLSAQAQTAPGRDVIDRLGQDGAIEALAARALSAIDTDAWISGFEQSAQAAAEGQAPGPNPALDAARTRMERQMAQAGPALAREVGGLFGPLLRELRAEIARDLAEDRLAEQGASPWPLD